VGVQTSPNHLDFGQFRHLVQASSRTSEFKQPH